MEGQTLGRWRQPAPPMGALKEEKSAHQYHLSSVVFLPHIEGTGKGG